MRSGLSQQAVARAIGVSRTHAGRIVRGDVEDIGLVRLAELLSVVGLELAARSFPAGPPIRDRAQLALLERLRARLHPSLGWRTEVPVVELATPGEVDLRAWDAAIDGSGWSVRVEAETRLRDVQAVLRRVALKQRDSRSPTVVLLVAETATNRAAIRLADVAFREAFPVSTRAALLALGRGDRPPGDALVIL